MKPVRILVLAIIISEQLVVKPSHDKFVKMLQLKCCNVRSAFLSFFSSAGVFKYPKIETILVKYRHR